MSDDDEQSLRGAVLLRQRAVADGNEGPEVVVDALVQLGEWLRGAERSREAVTTLGEARRIARAEVGASRASPAKQLAVLVEVDLVLADAQRESDDAQACLRTLAEAERAIAKHPALPIREWWSNEVTRIREAAQRPAARRADAEPMPAERFRHARFGEGVLVRREVSGLRLRFEDGSERVLREDRVSRIDPA
jgi:hypothetical protein